MFNFLKKTKIYCFTIENIEELSAQDSDFCQKLEESPLAIGAFTAKLDFPTKQFCVFVSYKNDPLAENPLFSVEKMREIIESFGCVISGIKE